MSSVTAYKVKIFKNQLYFHILTMDMWKLKLNMQCHVKLFKIKVKYLDINLIKQRTCVLKTSQCCCKNSKKV